MGAWGTGPFDSDSALDWLGNLADDTAQIDSNYEVIPGTVDHAAAAAKIERVLTKAASPLGEDEYRWGVYSYAYAAAGLVAGVVSGESKKGARGTRLGAAMTSRLSGGDPIDSGPDALGLGHACSYQHLLTEEDARALIPKARAAVDALERSGEWLDSWRDSEGMLDQFARLRALLPVPEAATAK